MTKADEGDSYSLNTTSIRRLYSQIEGLWGDFEYAYRAGTLVITVHEDTTWTACAKDAAGARQLGTFFQDAFDKNLVLQSALGEITLERVAPNSLKSGVGGEKVTGVSIAETTTLETAALNDRFLILSLHKKLHSGRIWSGDCNFSSPEGWTSKHIRFTLSGQRYDFVYLDKENDIWIFSEQNHLQIPEYASNCFLALELLHFLVGFDLTGEMTFGTCDLAAGKAGLIRRIHGRDIPARYNTLLESALDISNFSLCLEKCAIENEGSLTFFEYIRLASRCPLEVRGAMYAIALEVLTDMHSRGKKAEDILPVTSTEWDALRPEILELLEKHKVAAKLNGELRDGWRILGIRLETANQPTNADKLSKPFHDLNIILDKDAKTAIKKRNTLLHSGRIFKKEADRPTDYLNMILGIEANLFMLCAQLFLKRIGFSGEIIDWTKGSRSAAPRPGIDSIKL